jgi:colanic acid/amylovoran biosynthesis glycosyltransferase
MRIAYILLWFPEPSQTFVLNEVNTLVRLGLDLRVYTLYGPRPAERLAGMERAAAGVRHLGLASLGALLPDLFAWGHPGAGAFLRRVLLRRWRSQVTAGEALWAALAGVHLAHCFRGDAITHIHAPWADGPATAAWVASHLSGIPFSFSARAYDLHPPDGALLEKMAAAAFVRTNTRSNLRYLAHLAPDAASKLVNIYNGVALGPRAAPAPPPGSPFRLLALGRLVAKKGFPVLLAACRRLVEQKVDFRLTLAGAGPQRRPLAALVEKYRLGDRVTMPGFIPHREVPGLLAQADLLVMPSVIAPSGDRDGIPNVVLEALAHELPVVASAVSGLPEVILAGETGWLVPPEDPEALAAAILAALNDPSEARRRARAGRDLMAREFDSMQNGARLKAWLENRWKQGGQDQKAPVQ